MDNSVIQTPEIFKKLIV